MVIYMVCSCPLGTQAMGFPGWYRPGSAPTCAVPGATLHELISNLSWLLVLPGLEIPRQSQAVKLGWLLLVPGLGTLSKRLKERLMRLAFACLIGFRKL